MAVLVIAGSGRGAGKTAVGCALIAALPELQWVAVKVSPHEHDLDGGVWEETDFDSDKDTVRYLTAGAARAFLISKFEDAALAGAVAEIRKLSLDIGSLLIESNRVAPEMVARKGEPAVCLAVVCGAEASWKVSLRERIDSVDALVLTGGFLREELPVEFESKITFQLDAGQWSSPELIAFVRERLLN